MSYLGTGPFRGKESGTLQGLKKYNLNPTCPFGKQHSNFSCLQEPLLAYPYDFVGGLTCLDQLLILLAKQENLLVLD